MELQRIGLKNYRNFETAQFDFSKATVILADNTFGKTNILEAIYTLATGKPFRADKDVEAIKDETSYFDVSGELVVHEEEKKLRVFLENSEEGKRKQLQVNGVNRAISTFSGNLKAVLFTPENFDILNGSPSIRRKYLDSTLVQVNKEYAKSITKYKKVVYQRNRLLERIREGKSKRDELEYWDQNLVSLGRFIQEQRFQFFSFINDKISNYNFLYKSQKRVSFKYLCSEVNTQRLLEYQEKEIITGNTLIGPHRDDFETTLSEKKVHLFGSRGEQRLGILTFCLVILDYFEQYIKERPILLLDDIFSELDEYHRTMMLEILKQQQTIVTTTDWEFGDQDVKILTL